MRRDPEEMSVYALPNAVPLGERKQAAQREPFVDDPSISDGELIRRVAQRDADAFEALYRRYARSVFGLALRRLGDRMNPEAAVPESFPPISPPARTDKPDSGAGPPWLYPVARTAIVDRSGGRGDTPGEGPELASDEPTPAERAEASYTSWRV